MKDKSVKKKKQIYDRLLCLFGIDEIKILSYEVLKCFY